MTSDDRFERIRETLARGGGKPLSDAEVEDVEILAELEDGTLDLESVDEVALERTIARFGRAAVADAASQGEPVAGTTRAEEGPTAPKGPRPLPPQQPHADRAPWFGSPVLAAAAAVLLVGITALLVVRSNGSGRATDSLDLAGIDAVAVPTSAAAVEVALDSMDGAEPGWESSMRDVGEARRLPTELRRHAVIVRTEFEYGNGVVLDADGWVVTSSDLVGEAIQSAAWEGEVATVLVEVAEIDERGRARRAGEPRAARVMRHAPGLGLSLLRIVDGQAPALDALAVAATGPAAGDALRFQGATAGEMQAEVAGERAGLGALLGARGAAAATRVEPEVVTIAGAVFRRIDVGAPVYAGVDRGSPELVGIVVGGTRNETWCAPAESVTALLAGRPTAAEPHPVDPWVTPLGGTRSTSVGDRDGRLDAPALLTEVEDRSAARSKSLFLGAPPPANADSIPSGLPGSPTSGDHRFDVFLTWDEAGRIALGTTDGDGVVDRVVTGERATGLAAWVYARTDRAGVFDVRRARPGERIIDGLDRAESDRIGAVLSPR
ncbi:MAG: hypothetical protein AAF957_07515 [Planctomycetota bacterium]